LAIRQVLVGRRMATVLLAEPNASVRTTLKAVLERDGYRVRAAPSYAEAVPLLRAEKWELLITEVQLESDELGLKLAQKAKELKFPPAVFLYVSSPDMKQLRTALAVRVDYCAFKPVEVNELRNALRLLVVRRTVSRTARPGSARRRRETALQPYTHVKGPHGSNR
jgi:CheY-like chemotaxis protein